MSTKTTTWSEASDGFLSRAAGAKQSDIPRPYPVQPAATCAGESVCGSGACKRTQPAPAPWCIPWFPRRLDPRGRSWSCSEKPPLHLRRRRRRERRRESVQNILEIAKSWRQGHLTELRLHAVILIHSAIQDGDRISVRKYYKAAS